jgi:DNA-binding XRE family transcriptional regulator
MEVGPAFVDNVFDRGEIVRSHNISIEKESYKPHISICSTICPCKTRSRLRLDIKQRTWHGRWRVG